MMTTETGRFIGASLAGMAMVWTLGVSQASAQDARRGVIESGTTVLIRTSQKIDQNKTDGRVYTGVVDEDVRDARGRVAIPRGSVAELLVREGTDSNDLYLDLDSIQVNGQRYAVDASRHPVDRSGVDVKNSGIGNNDETVKHVGGGALIGTVLGAIVGGGKGAAVGAAVGAAGGAATQIYTHGRRVNVPSETLLTYRLQNSLDANVKDSGYDRDGMHYHSMAPSN